jgi:hypothetical protein
VSTVTDGPSVRRVPLAHLVRSVSLEQHEAADEGRWNDQRGRLKAEKSRISRLGPSGTAEVILSKSGLSLDEALVYQMHSRTSVAAGSWQTGCELNRRSAKVAGQYKGHPRGGALAS